MSKLVINCKNVYNAGLNYNDKADEIKSINEMLQKLNSSKLNSLLYDELYDESDFVFFALDYADEPEELETLLESENQTLVLKVITLLKEKGLLNSKHKDLALNHVTNSDIKTIITVM